jgi:uncharacterized protein
LEFFYQVGESESAFNKPYRVSNKFLKTKAVNIEYVRISGQHFGCSPATGSLTQCYNSVKPLMQRSPGPARDNFLPFDQSGNEMKFSQDDGLSGYSIHAYSRESITIIGPPAGEQNLPSQVTLKRSFIITPHKVINDWPPMHLKELEQEHFKPLIELAPEVVIIGVGNRLRFPDHALLSGLMESGVGIEIMDNAAACRTYNILASEGRRVAAAIIIGKE